MAITSSLDKTFDSASEELGTMSIRVVVVSKQSEAEDDQAADQVPLDLDEEEVLTTSGKMPTRTYLEDPKRGKECCVFLINGQRQDAWDNTFIVRELDKKYLRNRMLVAVDLDGLKPEVTADLMSGDRQGFFQGNIYQAMSARLVATLKRDPDLERLEDEAERELSELKSGDDDVKEALDQLIDSHHELGTHHNVGKGQGGTGPDSGPGDPVHRHVDVIVGPTDEGVAVDAPFLTANPTSPVFRLHPSEPSVLSVTTSSADLWRDTSELQVTTVPTVEGLCFSRNRTGSGEMFSFVFEEPSDFEDDQYPLECSLRITASIKGHDELRLLERRIVITKTNGKRTPPKPPALVDDPTYIKVTSRKPVSLVPLGAATHVRMRWDGKDHLAGGPGAPWVFSARCLTDPSFNDMSFSRPNGGRLELLILAPASFLVDQAIEFEVVATGPSGQELTDRFSGQVMSPPQPKKLGKVVPELSTARRPPYKLLYVKKENWGSGYTWSEDDCWSEADVGLYNEPSETKPLTLIINEDMALLKAFKDSLIKKKLEPNTVKKRVNHYTSHVAYHLYQMYLHAQSAQKSAEDSNANTTYELWRAEVNRVGGTLLKVMSVTQ